MIDQSEHVGAMGGRKAANVGRTTPTSSRAKGSCDEFTQTPRQQLRAAGQQIRAQGSCRRLMIGVHGPRARAMSSLRRLGRSSPGTSPGRMMHDKRQGTSSRLRAIERGDVGLVRGWPRCQCSRPTCVVQEKVSRAFGCRDEGEQAAIAIRTNPLAQLRAAQPAPGHPVGAEQHDLTAIYYVQVGHECLGVSTGASAA
ncbi:unnamed protein product [Durusdinium trenchii]|uniref:Uncharacterized protein n=1 Tax=Durusdinium trenchii TaxID=1381693 RepID=A0ABP0JWI7_9DINO